MRRLYQSVEQMTITYRKGAHCIFSIQLHTYLVTAYRRECLTQKMAERFSEVAANVLVKNKCILLECKAEPSMRPAEIGGSISGESNHIHLLLDIHPDNNISTLLGSIKSATSRILRKEFESELRPHFKNWSKGLWGDQLYIRSAGGAPLKILEEYIQSHRRG